MISDGAFDDGLKIMEEGEKAYGTFPFLFQSYETVFGAPSEAVSSSLFSPGSAGPWLERPFFQFYGMRVLVEIFSRFMQMEGGK